MLLLKNNNAFPPVASQRVNYRADYRPLLPNRSSGLWDPDVDHTVLNDRKRPIWGKSALQPLNSSFMFVFLWHLQGCCQPKSHDGVPDMEFPYKCLQMMIIISGSLDCDLCPLFPAQSWSSRLSVKLKNTPSLSPSRCCTQNYIIGLKYWTNFQHMEAKPDTDDCFHVGQDLKFLLSAPWWWAAATLINKNTSSVFINEMGADRHAL